MEAEGHKPLKTQISDEDSDYHKDDTMFAVKDSPTDNDTKASVQVEYDIALSPLRSSPLKDARMTAHLWDISNLHDMHEQHLRQHRNTRYSCLRTVAGLQHTSVQVVLKSLANCGHASVPVRSFRHFRA